MRDDENPANARPTPEVRLQQAKCRHPQQHSIVDDRRPRLHLFSAGPQLGRGGRRQLYGRAVIVNRGLGMQCKKEHEDAESYRYYAPQLFVLHGSKTHGESEGTPAFIIRVTAGLVSAVGGVRRSTPLVRQQRSSIRMSGAIEGFFTNESENAGRLCGSSIKREAQKQSGRKIFFTIFVDIPDL